MMVMQKVFFINILMLHRGLSQSLAWIVSTHPRVEKQVDVLVEKSLILLISCTEVLQELMSQFHDLLHSDIFTLSVKYSQFTL